MRKDLTGYSLITGPTIFILFTTIAMIIYRAGNPIDDSSLTYSFYYNFFSDLGMMGSFHEGNNSPVYIFFIIALVAMSILVIPFFLFMINYFKETNQKQYLILSIFGSIFGIIAVVSYIGVALTPWDLQLAIHMQFVYSAFIFILPTSLIYTYILLKNQNVFPSYMGYTFLIFLILAVFYLILLLYGPPRNVSTGRIIQAVGQKIIVYSEISTFLIQGIGLLKLKNSR